MREVLHRDGDGVDLANQMVAFSGYVGCILFKGGYWGR